MRAVYVSLVILLSTQNVSADWQNTKWGQSVGDVSTSDNNIEPVNAEDIKNYKSYAAGTVRLKSSKLINGITIRVYYYFDEKEKLIAINAKPETYDDSQKILNMLRNKYKYDAPPEESKSRSMLTISERWKSEADNNSIKFTSISVLGQYGVPGYTITNIKYEPINAPGGGGF